MNITESAARAYFESRLQGEKLPHGSEGVVHCPFHQDKTASLSLQLQKGLWKCHAGCGQGGLVDFEMKWASSDRETARTKVAEFTGETSSLFSAKPEATYVYRDFKGKVVFEKLRFPGKRFIQRRPKAEGGYEYKLDPTRIKPLYNLPEVLTSNYIAICEGEKDADNVSRALNGLVGDQWFFAATTTFDGAGKWRDDYAPYFTGKVVVVLGDNDDVGRKHAQRVARSVNKYAAAVKVVEFPELPEHGDVSDFLAGHSPNALLDRIRQTTFWIPPEPAKGLFVDAASFVGTAPERVDWLVEGVIQRGANGFIAASPKAGKSWAMLDLALSLTTGSPFLDFDVKTPVRVAVVSREDNPALTAWRIRHLFQGKGQAQRLTIDQDLYVNSRQQSPVLMLDDDEQRKELIENLERMKPDILFMDVFNILHTAEENDNSAMREVLEKVNEIHRKVGCAIGIVHHFGKNTEGTLINKIRGASAISGWAEWVIGISVVDEVAKVRKMEFECKAGAPPDPVYYRIVSEGGDSPVMLQRTTYEEQSKAKGGPRLV